MPIVPWSETMVACSVGTDPGDGNAPAVIELSRTINGLVLCSPELGFLNNKFLRADGKYDSAGREWVSIHGKSSRMDSILPSQHGPWKKIIFDLMSIDPRKGYGRGVPFCGQELPNSTVKILFRRHLDREP